MWLYYQTAEDSRGAWQLASHDQDPALRSGVAFHIGPYQLDRVPTAGNAGEVRYKGDFWIDIDHKPSAANPSAADAVHRAIVDLKKLLNYFDSIGLDPRYCRLFATGSKGFHLCVPGRLFGAANAYKLLPRIHKRMAQVLETHASVDGLDLQLYNMGRGGMLRVENKQRANGHYKVPITYSEAQIMTPELYHSITLAPRPEVPASAPKGLAIEALTILFGESREEVKQSVKLAYDCVPDEQLEAFVKTPPVCVQWLLQGINLAPARDSFNEVKMSLARYAAAAPISDSDRDALIEDFARNRVSASHPTVQSKILAVRATLKFGKEQGFSCAMMRRVLSESPCAECPVRAAQQEQAAAVVGVEASPLGYFRIGAKGVKTDVCNFTLKPVFKYSDADDRHLFTAYDYEVLERGQDKSGRLITLTARAWLSSLEFKKQLQHQAGLSWYGSDIDLQHIRSYLTSPAMDQGVKPVKTIKTLGVYHHFDVSGGIDEYVWVEPGWSISANRIADTVHYDGHRRENNGSINTVTVPMRQVPTLDSADAAFNLAYQALLRINHGCIIGPIIGWMAACWLKPYILAGINQHFPALEVCGESGVGKTETIRLLASLGGADYTRTGPLVVSGSTPYALVAEAALTTSVPRVLDEMNEHKMFDRRKYRAACEAIKASCSGGTMPQGTLSASSGAGGSSVMIDERPLHAPMVYMATQPNLEKELVNRSVSVLLTSVYKAQHGHRRNFNIVQPRARALFPLAKALMTEALSIAPGQVEDWMIANKALLPEGVEDRIGKNWQVVLTGLDFLTATLSRYRMAAALVTETDALKGTVLGMLKAKAASGEHLHQQQEVDLIIDRIGEMAAIVDNHGESRVRSGLHYTVQGGVLHLFANATFVMYVKYMREMGRVPELADVQQFRSLLAHQPYFLGAGKAPGVKAPQDWYSFSIPGLEQRGISVQRFIDN